RGARETLSGGVPVGPAQPVERERPEGALRVVAQQALVELRGSVVGLQPDLQQVLRCSRGAEGREVRRRGSDLQRVPERPARARELGARVEERLRLQEKRALGGRPRRSRWACTRCAGVRQSWPAFAPGSLQRWAARNPESGV